MTFELVFLLFRIGLNQFFLLSMDPPTDDYSGTVDTLYSWALAMPYVVTGTKRFYGNNTLTGTLARSNV